jgi:hypothetical protein
MNKPIFYRDVVRFEQSQRGEYQDLSYEPTFRASAIFFVILDDKTNTHVSFMNYWREKNNNPFVSALVTVRDGDGCKIHREFEILEDFVYQFDLKNLVAQKVEYPFIGSVEFEFFSIQDLKYSFPALNVFYEAPDGVSFVHSNQRVFNNIQDNDRSSSLSGWQTGFDIYADNEYSGYLTLINGPRPVDSDQLDLQVFNRDGQVKEERIDLGNLKAYSTKFINIEEEIPNLKSFLNSQAGFCKVLFDSFGVFQRIACGNFSKDRSRFSVTHSYYDCNDHNDYIESSHVDNEEYKCFLPFGLVENLELDLVFYPIYAPSNLLFSLDCFSPTTGNLEATVDNFASFQSIGTKHLRFNIRKILQEHKLPTSEDRLYCLHINTIDGRIPSRLTFGMNYSKEGIGCNINSSMLLSSSYGLRRRLYLWGPLIYRESGRNNILLAHLSKQKELKEEAEIHLKILARREVVSSVTYHTVNGSFVNINAENIIAQSGYTPNHNEILWYVLESKCPNYVCNQIYISESGFVGGDHSF